jgi:hypothetical protein
MRPWLCRITSSVAAFDFGYAHLGAIGADSSMRSPGAQGACTSMVPE